jgi:hypothetical protein
MRRSLIRPLTAVGFALVAGLATLVVAPGQANADAVVCTNSHGVGSTCVSVKGNADVVQWVSVSHNDPPLPPSSICDYAAGVWYTPVNSSEQFYATGIYYNCTSPWVPQVSIRINFGGMTMRNPSYVAGQFYHDGNWAPGRPAAVVSRA